MRATSCLIHDFEAKLFNDRIREDFLGNALHLRLRFVAAPAIKIQYEEFSLAHVRNLRVTQAGKCVLNGFSLWIEHRALRHHPDMCFHGTQYSSLQVAQRAQVLRRAVPREKNRLKPVLLVGVEGVAETVLHNIRQFIFRQAHSVRVLVLFHKRGMKHGRIVC